jgi:hypothetical protein
VQHLRNERSPHLPTVCARRITLALPNRKKSSHPSQHVDQPDHNTNRTYQDRRPHAHLDLQTRRPPSEIHIRRLAGCTRVRKQTSNPTACQVGAIRLEDQMPLSMDAQVRGKEHRYKKEGTVRTPIGLGISENAHELDVQVHCPPMESQNCVEQFWGTKQQYVSTIGSSDPSIEDETHV